MSQPREMNISEEGHRRKKIKVDRSCVNPDCTKSTSENLVTAKPFAIAYFGVKVEDSRKRKICQDCYLKAQISLQGITQNVQAGQPFLDQPLPIIKDKTIVLDDSDEDEGAKTDSSVESVMEIELHKNETVEDLIVDTINKLKIPDQINGAVKELSSRMDALDSDAADINANFLALEKEVDELRASLFAPFEPEVSYIAPIEITDVQSDVNLLPLISAGEFKPTSLIRGEKVFALKEKDTMDLWDEASIEEIGLDEDDLSYKVKFQSFSKSLTLKHIASLAESKVRIQVGTRVAALYINPANDLNMGFQSGIIAEPPKIVNKYRYLIFFDKGYASYVKHIYIRVVCDQTKDTIFKDIPPKTRNFVMKYLEEYPKRNLVQLSKGQHLSVYSAGSWKGTVVEGVESSLVRVVFNENGRKEEIYRGSVRLLPIYKHMKKKNAESNEKRFARRNHVLNKSKPYIEYTQNSDDEFTTNENDVSLDTMGKGLCKVKGPTARKSTTKRNRTGTHKPDPNRIRWESKGKIRSVDVECAEAAKFEKHTCSSLCIDDPKYVFDPEKSIKKDEKLKNFSPLLIPIILGWKRQITKRQNMGKRSVYYVAPCGRRLRNIKEVFLYLRVTHSALEIDFFNFDFFVHVFNYFTPARINEKIDDVTYGRENVAVSCVNSVDNSYPEYLDYSKVRLPQKNVEIPLDEGFLTCCDCDDGCQDKERCSCMQLTIQSTDASNSEKIVNTNAGYKFRRLFEGIPTGIYECNKFCKCSKTCLNRVAQNPLRLPLQIFKTERRGWGIRTLVDLPKGSFICIYVGKLYSNEEANMQGQDYGDEYFAELDLIEVVESQKEGYESDYEDECEILDADQNNPELALLKDEDESKQIKETGKNSKNSTGDGNNTPNKEKESSILSSDDHHCNCAESKQKFVSTRKYFQKGGDFYVMDAKCQGNIGRYINHSCNPNVFVQNCFVDTHDLRFPWIAFFASRCIIAGEELVWDYNYQVNQVAGKEILCLCGSTDCRGRLL